MGTATTTEPRIKYPAQQEQLLITCDDDEEAQAYVIRAAESMGFRVQWVATELVDTCKGERAVMTEECFERVFAVVKAQADSLISSGEVDFPGGYWPMTTPDLWSTVEKRRFIKLAVDWFGFGHEANCDPTSLANSLRWGQLNI